MEKGRHQSAGFGIRGWSIALGHGFAHLQDACDRALDWGFKRITQSAESTALKSEKSAKRSVATAKGAARGALRFVGWLGNAYYDRYHELKKRRSA
ncbi:hypothetical protein COU80_03850 [Candidatus Peregrinibacteria bacterium CG10_big_fil_rev_8_21_14_0_10_55_24]|nr:MAG: hypothetical protein COU80_03850 [Candidatus Peregrinibacteria bacterium CG10_big_fil_rev_8_21_14_0_10_55_24]